MIRLTKILIILLCFLILVPARSSSADENLQPDGITDIQTADGDVLCIPGNQSLLSDDCLVLGPSAVLNTLAEKHMFFPLAPLPAITPDETLNKVPFLYAKLNLEFGQMAGVYGSVDDAVSGSNKLRDIAAGQLIYLSYVQQADVNGNHYLQLLSGEWVRASPSTYRDFQGLEFSDTPDHDFGWVINESKPHSGPGYNFPELDITYYRENVIQIYDIQMGNGVEWYLIGFNQWLDRPNVRQVVVSTETPDGIQSDRWIEVNLYEQTLTIYENHELRFAALIATGDAPYYTQPGVFQIYEKKPTENMSGAFEADRSDYYYLEDVPWTMYFDKSRALHGAYWRTMFGYTQSHGCVNLSVGDSRWIYDWAAVGDWVYVHDPSGKTPTDPAVYSQGGA
ncbi:MAG: L,D-transpeptidase [Anaerolineaceae bacterium]|nr:L,D-transpeptidase [Anaerolineaceae bacterium]